jgi:hypothetical protein
MCFHMGAMNINIPSFVNFLCSNKQSQPPTTVNVFQPSILLYLGHPDKRHNKLS